ncbi:MAG TPA: glycosyltransferase, partial [Chthonomonadales bacterium]|nr:glycosyltransferase [Chthonomonadales bacterium]
LPDEEVPALMAATDVGIAPFSSSSGSGSLALLLAYGIPVIASDIAPHKELVSTWPNSMMLFESRDAEALAKALTTLRATPDLQQELRHGALKFAESHSYVNMARETVEVYKKVVEGA